MRNFINAIRENLIHLLGGYTREERESYAEVKLGARNREIALRIETEKALIRAGRVKEPNTGYIMSGIDA